jgi:Cu+-exporting ATPase
MTAGATLIIGRVFAPSENQRFYDVRIGSRRPISHANGNTWQRRYTMARDPVCGMDVNEQQAAGKSEYQGQTYYFCSSNCKQQFDQNPQRYASGGTTQR